MKELTPTYDIYSKAHRIVADGSFWFPESSEKNRMCKKYGRTSGIYNKIINKQDGCCAICGIHQSQLLYIFSCSCKMNDVEPSVCLKDVLNHLPDYKTNKLHELLPNSRKSLE